MVNEQNNDKEETRANPKNCTPLGQVGRLVSTDNGYEHKIILDGISGFVFSVKDDGQKITVSGWNNDHWDYDVGHRVVLLQKDGTESRYKIDRVEHCGDPNDQYFINCSFHPRT